MQEEFILALKQESQRFRDALEEIRDIANISEGVEFYAILAQNALEGNNINLLEEYVMVENQHKKILGYRDLSEEEIQLMNRVKGLGETIGKLIAELQETKSLDQRWVSIANTDLQKGIMFAVRSIAQPTSY